MPVTDRLSASAAVGSGGGGEASSSSAVAPFQFLRLHSFSTHTNTILRKLEHAITAAPDQPQAYLALGEEYRVLGARHSYVRLLEWGKKRFPDSAEFRTLLDQHHPNRPRTPPPPESRVQIERNRAYDYKYRNRDVTSQFPKALRKSDTSQPPIGRQLRANHLAALSLIAGEDMYLTSARKQELYAEATAALASEEKGVVGAPSSARDEVVLMLPAHFNRTAGGPPASTPQTTVPSPVVQTRDLAPQQTPDETARAREREQREREAETARRAEKEAMEAARLAAETAAAAAASEAAAQRKRDEEELAAAELQREQAAAAAAKAKEEARLREEAAAQAARPVAPFLAPAPPTKSTSPPSLSGSELLRIEFVANGLVKPSASKVAWPSASGGDNVWSTSPGVFIQVFGPPPSNARVSHADERAWTVLARTNTVCGGSSGGDELRFRPVLIDVTQAGAIPSAPLLLRVMLCGSSLDSNPSLETVAETVTTLQGLRDLRTHARGLALTNKSESGRTFGRVSATAVERVLAPTRMDVVRVLDQVEPDDLRTTTTFMRLDLRVLQLRRRRGGLFGGSANSHALFTVHRLSEAALDGADEADRQKLVDFSRGDETTRTPPLTGSEASSAFATLIDAAASAPLVATDPNAPVPSSWSLAYSSEIAWSVPDGGDATFTAAVLPLSSLCDSDLDQPLLVRLLHADAKKIATVRASGRSGAPVLPPHTATEEVVRFVTTARLLLHHFLSSSSSIAPLTFDCTAPSPNATKSLGTVSVAHASFFVAFEDRAKLAAFAHTTPQ